ncbi:cytokinin dehydrogenase 3-like protein [Tanacetum coccineum]
MELKAIEFGSHLKEVRVIFSQDVTFDEDYLFRVKQDPIESKLQDGVSRKVEDIPKQVEHVVPGDMDHDDTSPDDHTNLQHVELEHIAAMGEEIESLHKNKTWELVKLPKKRKVVGCIVRITYLLTLVVVDMLVCDKDMEEVKKLKILLNTEFDMKNLGATRKILGMEIIRDQKHDSDYAADLDARRSLTDGSEGRKFGLKGLIEDLGIPQDQAIVFCDSMNAICLAKDQCGGRGVKEKDLNRNSMDTTLGIGLSTESDDTMNEDTPIVVASVVKEVVTPSVVDMTVEKEKLNSLKDTTGRESFSPLSTLGTTTAVMPRESLPVSMDSIHAISERFANTAYGFFLGKKVAYHVVANYVSNTWGFIRNNPLILKKWHPDENLLKEDDSTVPVWVKLHGVPATAFRDGLSTIATKLGTPLTLDSYTSDMCMQSWGMSSYARVMIELRAYVELKDNIVVAMLKITREGHYTCNVRNTCVGEKKTVKKPSQTSRGVPVGPKMDFKPQKEYRPVLKKSTASSSGNKKKRVEPTIEVSNSNPFDVLNSVDNDGEFGTNSSNTPIGKKIDKIERQICEGKLRLLDNDGNPLLPTGIVKSVSEVEVIFDETTNLKILTSGKDGSDKGYGTNSLLEQLRDSYPDNDDYDPYDDDMYEYHDMSEHLQSICDDLDITVRSRKKK